MRHLLVVTMAAGLLAACGAQHSDAQAQKPPAVARLGPPEETRPPNAPNQRPAFPGQTRAPRISANAAFQVLTVAAGLDHPWSLVFLPSGEMLVSERVGRLRIVGRAGKVSAPLAGAPRVTTGEQSGLFGLALDPAFASNHLVYMAYEEARAGGRFGLTVARARLVQDPGEARLEDMQVIFRATPAVGSKANLGGRLVFAPDGTLFVTSGDHLVPAAMRQAQTLDNDIGKVLRLQADGAAPKDNPFAGKAGARPEIWSIGHRNPEAAAINPWTHKLWIVEHGPRGGDEVNIPAAGRNYGWPVITYGEDYSGEPIGRGITQQPGLEQPIYYWDPVIAPSGMAFYNADTFPAWKGSLFVGGLGSEHLARLTLKGDRVVGEEWLLKDLHERFRDLVVGPDGALYLLTDADDGRILALAPR